jgi:hypothetical protein
MDNLQAMLYCSKCDKRLTPDHICGLSRRFFFGLIAGAAASAFVPPSTPDNVLLRAGDLLQVNLSSAEVVGGALITVSRDGRQFFIQQPKPVGPWFMAKEAYTVESIRAVVGSTVRDMPFKVVRSRDLALGRTLAGG